MAHGYAPYEEAAVKGQARMSMLQRLGQIFAGAGYGLAATPQNAGGIESLATGFAGGYGQANAARQAAEQYAMKKIEAERANEERQSRIAENEARAEALKHPPPRPEKPAPPIKKDITTMTDEEWVNHLRRLEEESKAKSAGRPKPMAKGGTAPKLKPLSTPRRIPLGLEKTEGDLLREIQWTPKDPKEQAALPAFEQHLVDIMSGRAEYDSPGLRHAAQMRLNAIQREGR